MSWLTPNFFSHIIHLYGDNIDSNTYKLYKCLMSNAIRLQSLLNITGFGSYHKRDAQRNDELDSVSVGLSFNLCWQWNESNGWQINFCTSCKWKCHKKFCITFIVNFLFFNEFYTSYFDMVTEQLGLPIRMIHTKEKSTGKFHP